MTEMKLMDAVASPEDVQIVPRAHIAGQRCAAVGSHLATLRPGRARLVGGTTSSLASPSIPPFSFPRLPFFPASLPPPSDPPSPAQLAGAPPLMK